MVLRFFPVCLLISALTLDPGYAQTSLPTPNSGGSQTSDVALLTSTPQAANTAQPFGLADNMELVYRLLDDDGKPTGEVRQRVVRLMQQEREEKKKQKVTENTALLKSGMYDKRNILEHLQDLTFRARRDTCFTDGLAEVNFGALRSFRDRKITYEPVPLAWPNQPAIGSELPDGGVTVKVSSSVVSIASVTTTLRKRRVIAGPQSLTTPAGTFSCYQVEAEREEATVPRPDMAMRTTLHQVDFYAPGVGIVRTEIYTKNGKLNRVRELTARNTAAAGNQGKAKYKTKK